jgi:hypothetical protein
MENDSFDDVDQLGAYLKDTKATDKLRKSTIAEARAKIETLRTDAGAWASLDRGTVADRLLELVGPESSDTADQPDQAGRAVQQGSLNLCGPAAFFQFVIKRDPLMFAVYATDMFNTGLGSLGSLSVTPSADITSADYGALLPRMTSGVCPQADWMVLGALRNSTDAFWAGTFRGDPRQEIAAGTRPSEIADWMKQTGLYSSVANEANWMTSAGVPHAEGLSMAAGSDIAALINADLIRAARNLPAGSSWPMTDFPNHWVTVIGEPAKDVAKDAVFFNIWTWGDALALEVPTAAFIANYYGAIKATVAT